MKERTAQLIVLLTLVQSIARAQSSFEIALPSGKTASIEKWHKSASRDRRPCLSFSYTAFSYTASERLDEAKARALSKDIWAVLAPDIYSQEVCYASLRR